MTRAVEHGKSELARSTCWLSEELCEAWPCDYGTTGSFVESVKLGSFSFLWCDPVKRLVRALLALRTGQSRTSPVLTGEAGVPRHRRTPPRCAHSAGDRRSSARLSACRDGVSKTIACACLAAQLFTASERGMDAFCSVLFMPREIRRGSVCGSSVQTTDKFVCT